MSTELFKRSSPGTWGAVVGGSYASDWAYENGFLEAADHLVDAHARRQVTDTSVYPACFLYRHAAELTLKGLIREVEGLIAIGIQLGAYPESAESTRDVAKGLLTTHGIAALTDWLVDRVAVVTDLPIPPPTLDALRALHRADPSGQAFRYARTRVKGGGTAPSLPEQQNIDLGHLRESLGEAIRMLQWGVGGWLSNEVDLANEAWSYEMDQRAEYEAEMRAEQASYEADMRAEYEADMRAEYEYEADMPSDME